MSELPKEWQAKPHYEPAVAWFTREPRTRRFFGEDIVSEESEEHPGWYFYLRADKRDMVDSLPEAIASVKTVLKNWDMHDHIGNRIPFQPSKEERKRMVVQLLEYTVPDPTPAYDPDSDDPQPELVKLKWEFAEYLLVITIWYSPHAERFYTQMSKPNSPIRSLVEKVCTLQATSQADLDRELEDEDFEAEWQTISVGTLALEDNRLTIGFWSHEFDPEIEVEGLAYEDASFEDKTMSYFLERGAPNERTR